MNIKLGPLLLLTTLSTSLFALPQATTNMSDDNDCAYLSVMISNNTDQNCELTAKNVVHGNMSSGSQVPELLPPHSSSHPFNLRQTVYGPDIVLTYQCGVDARITVESQQNVCYFSAGTITGNVYSHLGMNASYTKEEGSAWWGRHGSISWKLIQ